MGREVENRILSFLLENKQANAKQLEKIAGCSNKTFLKARQQLEKHGLITKRYEPKPGGGLHAIYSLTKKGIEAAEREALKTEIDKASPEEIEKIKKELRHYKVLNRIYELKDSPLPLGEVMKKLTEFGFKPEDYYSLETVDRILQVKKKKGIINGLIVLEGGAFIPPDFILAIPDGFSLNPKDTEEIKLIFVPEKEAIPGKAIVPFEYLQKHGVTAFNMEAWQAVTSKPIKGYYVLGAYKELLKLLEENQLPWKILNDELLKYVGFSFPKNKWLFLTAA